MRAVDFLNAWKSVWSNIFSQTRIANPGEGDSTTDVVQMDTDYPVPLTRLEQFGDVVCPPKDGNCIIWRKSDDGVVMSLSQTTTRPTDFKSGDRGLYCSQAGSVVKLHGNNSGTPGAIEVKQATGASVVISQGGDIVLTDADGNTATLSGDTLTVSDVVMAKHFSGDGPAPTSLPGAALGSGGTAILSSDSTDAALRIDFQAGSMGTSPGELCTITFAKKYARAPKVAHAPLDDIAAGATMAGKFHFATSQVLTETKLTISTTATPTPSDFFSLSVIMVR